MRVLGRMSVEHMFQHIATLLIESALQADDDRTTGVFDEMPELCIT